MRTFLIIVLGVGLFSLYQYHTANIPPPPLDSGAGQTAALWGGLFVLVPMLALIAAIGRLFRGLGRFHGRMRRDGLW